MTTNLYVIAKKSQSQSKIITKSIVSLCVFLFHFCFSFALSLSSSFRFSLSYSYYIFEWLKIWEKCKGMTLLLLLLLLLRTINSKNSKNNKQIKKKVKFACLKYFYTHIHTHISNYYVLQLLRTTKKWIRRRRRRRKKNNKNIWIWRIDKRNNTYLICILSVRVYECVQF